MQEDTDASAFYTYCTWANLGNRIINNTFRRCYPVEQISQNSAACAIYLDCMGSGWTIVRLIHFNSFWKIHLFIDLCRSITLSIRSRTESSLVADDRTSSKGITSSTALAPPCTLTRKVCRPDRMACQSTATTQHHTRGSFSKSSTANTISQRQVQSGTSNIRAASTSQCRVSTVTTS